MEKNGKSCVQWSAICKTQHHAGGGNNSGRNDCCDKHVQENGQTVDAMSIEYPTEDDQTYCSAFGDHKEPSRRLSAYWRYSAAQGLCVPRCLPLPELSIS